MNKHSIIAMILLLLLGFASYFLVEHIETFEQLPYKREYTLDNISNAITDEEKNLYIIKDPRSSILKLNSAGEFLFEIKAEKAANFFSSFTNLAIDIQGDLYVVQREASKYTNILVSESIIRYKSDGKFDKVIYSVDHSTMKNPSAMDGIKSFYLDKNKLHFITLIEGAIELKELSLATDEIVSNKAIQFEDEANVQQSIATPAGVVYTTKQGEVFQLVNDHPRLVFKNERNGIGRGVPELLHTGAGQKIYFFDRQNKEIIAISLDSNYETVFLSKNTLEKQGYSISLNGVQSIQSGFEQTGIVVALSDRVLTFSTNGTLENVFTNQYLTQKNVVFNWFVWLLPLFLFLLIIYTSRFIFINIMHGRMSLMIKQVALFLIISMISIVIFSGLFSNYLAMKLETESSESLAMLAISGSKMVDVAMLDKLQTPFDYGNDEYNVIKSSIQDWNEVNHQIGFYSKIYKYENGVLYTLIDGNKPIFSPVLSPPVDLGIFQEKLVSMNVVKAQEGKWIEAISPIYSSNGEIIGLFEVGKNDQGYLYAKAEFAAKMKTFIMILVIIATAVFAAFTVYMYYPLYKLRKALTEIAKGQWETGVTINTRDEISYISKQVNLVTEHVRRFFTEMTNLNETYYRFVPQQFLQYLGKDSIRYVELGDQTEQEMSLLVLKMRSFFSYSKSLTPEENFSFINSFLGRFSPIIQNYDGFINKYMGAGLFSLFPKKSSDAIESAIAIRQELTYYNETLREQGKRPIQLGIGIHKGPIMLGIVGDKERLEGAVISDQANLTELLEHLSNQLDVNILVTDSIINDLDSTTYVRYRNLGMISVSERDEPIQLFDIYEGDTERSIRLKNDTKDAFEYGIKMYQQGRFYDARTNFIDVIKRNPSDTVAKKYFHLCDEYYQHGTYNEWSGTLVLK